MPSMDGGCSSNGGSGKFKRKRAPTEEESQSVDSVSPGAIEEADDDDIPIATRQGSGKCFRVRRAQQEQSSECKQNNPFILSNSEVRNGLLQACADMPRLSFCDRMLLMVELLNFVLGEQELSEEEVLLRGNEFFEAFLVSEGKRIQQHNAIYHNNIIRCENGGLCVRVEHKQHIHDVYHPIVHCPVCCEYFGEFFHRGEHARLCIHEAPKPSMPRGLLRRVMSGELEEEEEEELPVLSDMRCMAQYVLLTLKSNCEHFRVFDLLHALNQRGFNARTVRCTIDNLQQSLQQHKQQEEEQQQQQQALTASSSSSSSPQIVF